MGNMYMVMRRDELNNKLLSADRSEGGGVYCPYCDNIYYGIRKHISGKNHINRLDDHIKVEYERKFDDYKINEQRQKEHEIIFNKCHSYINKKISDHDKELKELIIDSKRAYILKILFYDILKILFYIGYLFIYEHIDNRLYEVALNVLNLCMSILYDALYLCASALSILFMVLVVCNFCIGTFGVISRCLRRVYIID